MTALDDIAAYADRTLQGSTLTFALVAWVKGEQDNPKSVALCAHPDHQSVATTALRTCAEAADRAAGKGIDYDMQRLDRAIAHRFRFAADILEGMTDGIDGDRLGALMRWARKGEVAPAESEALIRIFAAPWIAAAEEAGWEGDERVAAEDDIARVTAEAAALRRAA